MAIQIIESSVLTSLFDLIYILTQKLVGLPKWK